MIKKYLEEIYGNTITNEQIERLVSLTNVEKKVVEKIDHKTSYLITYGDAIREEGKNSIEVINQFFKEKYNDLITDIHILPMYPYSSDDGFSVIDFLEIDPLVGNWDAIKNVSKDKRLMFDFVANHISQHSYWFQQYLAGNEKYANYFTTKEEGFDYSNVVRPRALPLFYKYENGVEVLATFSKDQVDLNFREPEVLIELTKILIEYINKGATSIRLDAIGFIWKVSGTTCIHLPEAHKIIQLWREIIDMIAPNVQIITETNVPHLENISYFGNGTNEAHQVYQFTLPPMTLHTFITGNATDFNNWAKTIKLPSKEATFFNFLASHDGIGMRPVEGILSDEQIEHIKNHTKNNGGLFGLKNLPDGTTSVYELNITYLDAIRDQNLDENTNTQRFLAAHFILMSFVGVPAMYYNSLVGTSNDYKGVEVSDINRRINRRKFDVNELNEAINNSELRQKVIATLSHLLATRSNYEAFDPYYDQEILDVSSDIVAIKRSSGSNEIISIVNITNHEVENPFSGMKDVITNEIVGSKLAPYEYAWLINE